jgi:hypothetical protein
MIKFRIQYREKSTEMTVIGTSSVIISESSDELFKKAKQFLPSCSKGEFIDPYGKIYPIII